jgi:hypothetical protein
MRLNRKQRRALKASGLLRRPRLERLEDKLAPAVFTVTNTNDGGAGSLDEAIFLAENTPNVNGVPDEVHFDIPGAGVHTIRPTQSFPVLTDPVIIDGYTQFDDANANGVWDIGEDRASPNTLAVGDNAVINVEIEFSSRISDFDLFLLGADNSTIADSASTTCSTMLSSLVPASSGPPTSTRSRAISSAPIPPARRPPAMEPSWSSRGSATSSAARPRRTAT